MHRGVTWEMAVLLQIANASKRYGEQVLLDGANAIISDNVKVGFIGRNGAGKSTLLRILLGEEELDSGEVIRSSSLRLGYLRQHDPFLPGETSLEYLMRDSGQPDWKCGEVAGQFELKGMYLDGPISKLSGGWQTRVKLAALLLHDPNLLLLDEPTNFLDLRTQILLEHFLQEYRAACLIVSHDRAFLGATCSHTLDLARGKLSSFPGKVDAYLQYLEEKSEHDERSNAAIMAKRRHLEDFIARNKARASTAKLAQSKSKQLEKLELNDIASDLPTARIRAPRVEPRKGPALRCKDLAIGYPEREIASGIGMELDHGSRAAIVGDNGQGKTTFLRTLVDSLKPVAGVHQSARWTDRIGLSSTSGLARQKRSGNSRYCRFIPVPWPQCPQTRFGSLRWRARTLMYGRIAAERVQYPHSGRTGKPLGCRYSRGSCGGVARVRRNVDIHQPR